MLPHPATYNRIFNFTPLIGLDRLDNITVKNYQALDHAIKNSLGIQHYDYIICDECHYFITDAAFNNYTDLSYGYIKQCAEDAVVVFMSATASKFFYLLKKQYKERVIASYSMKKDYSYVEALYFYKSKDLTRIIDTILLKEAESKIVVFCYANRMKEMYLYYGKKADYYCSASSHDRDLLKIRTKCLHNGTFEKRILFTTTALDNGIDLKDVNIKHIVSEIKDVDVLVQTLGRKRSLGDEDRCSFYIRDWKKQEFQFEINSRNKLIDAVQLFKKDLETFKEKYANDRELTKSRVFYTDTDTLKLTLNKMVVLKNKADLEMFKKISESDWKVVVCKALGEDILSKYRDDIQLLPEFDQSVEYLDSLLGKKLFREEQEQVKKYFSTKVFGQRRAAGINTINGILADYYKEYGYRFGFKKLKKNRSDRNTSRCWILEKTGDFSNQCVI